MASPDDRTILEYARLRAATPEEVCNYCEQRFKELVQMIRAKPVPPQPTGAMLEDAHAAQEFNSANAAWHGRFRIHYGRCMEAIIAAQGWGLIGDAQAKALKKKLDSEINWKLANAVMGGLT